MTQICSLLVCCVYRKKGIVVIRATRPGATRSLSWIKTVAKGKLRHRPLLASFSAIRLYKHKSFLFRQKFLRDQQRNSDIQQTRDCFNPTCHFPQDTSPRSRLSYITSLLHGLP
ncbi:hypothetical protein VTK73DRAFT_8648 [Phialemonium thermophilum]|uniref:Uncharacterized protein n=1 Tax=Phialemonium thermophilum TaxID=223376 RepID=A0ABR3W785_9PEZI